MVRMAEIPKFKELIDAIVAADDSVVRQILSETPQVATATIKVGATRENPTEYFVDELKHYLYAGDTALHTAAMAYRAGVAKLLVQSGADVRAKNRRGAEPLHYAADGSPNLPTWDPEAQYKTVMILIELGADPNCLDKSGVAPIHRAVRTRCTGAVRALIDGGADVNLKNKAGSTPLLLTTMTTGKSGSGSVETKRECEQIIKLLKKSDAKPID